MTVKKLGMVIIAALLLLAVISAPVTAAADSTDEEYEEMVKYLQSSDDDDDDGVRIIDKETGEEVDRNSDSRSSNTISAAKADTNDDDDEEDDDDDDDYTRLTPSLKRGETLFKSLGFSDFLYDAYDLLNYGFYLATGLALLWVGIVALYHIVIKKERDPKSIMGAVTSLGTIKGIVVIALAVLFGQQVIDAIFVFFG